MVKVGDKVRIGPAGVSVFRVLEFDDEGRAVIESVTDAPGRYPFPMPVRDLVPNGPNA
ncbi:hypothetical protein [Nocardia sp. IFM 10818]